MGENLGNVVLPSGGKDAARVRGLTGFQIKIIALVTMTLDHIAAYGFGVSWVGPWIGPLRLIGRIAAPLFVLMLVESLRHTRSKPRFLLRLYGGAVATGLVYALCNLSWGSQQWTPGNMMFTLFYIALFSYLIEKIWENRHQGGKRLVVPLLVLGFAVVVPVLLCHWTYGMSTWIPSGNELVYDLFRAVMMSPVSVEFSWIFVCMGVFLYFAPGKVAKSACILFVGGLAYLGSSGWWDAAPYLPGTAGFFGMGQLWMILALPIYWLYNGQRGKDSKYFFYGYYPLHQAVIHGVFAWIR